MRALQKSGHDVVWIRTASPGISDMEVLSRAQKEKRIVITFDKDFGELAFKQKHPAVSGVILFRISAPTASHVARVAVAALKSRSDWSGHFAVIENHRIRMTALPAGRGDPGKAAKRR